VDENKTSNNLTNKSTKLTKCSPEEVDVVHPEEVVVDSETVVAVVVEEVNNPPNKKNQFLRLELFIANSPASA
jgi:hypothetical protein